MEINVNFVLVKKFAEPVAEGFQAVEIQDSFVYKGEIVRTPVSQPCFVGDHRLAVGDVIVFAKYSPDTVEIKFNDVDHKFVKVSDVLAVID